MLDALFKVEMQLHSAFNQVPIIRAVVQLQLEAVQDQTLKVEMQSPLEHTQETISRVIVLSLLVCMQVKLVSQLIALY